MARAVMVILTEVPAGLESDYNRWYNEVHLPEVLAIPGVLSGRRFRINGDGVRYMALYELEHANVISSPAYATSVGLLLWGLQEEAASRPGKEKKGLHHRIGRWLRSFLPG